MIRNWPSNAFGTARATWGVEVWWALLPYCTHYLINLQVLIRLFIYWKYLIDLDWMGGWKQNDQVLTWLWRRWERCFGKEVRIVGQDIWRVWTANLVSLSFPLRSCPLSPVKLLQAGLSTNPVGGFWFNRQFSTNFLLVQPRTYHSGCMDRVGIIIVALFGRDYSTRRIWQNIHSFARLGLAD